MGLELSKDAIQQIAAHYIQNHDVKGTLEQRDALKCISVCRTNKLGGTKITCSDCGHEQFLYKSCGNRNCPKCNSLKQLCWKEARSSEAINTSYYHAVFTVPDDLNPLFLQHPKECYNLLFQATADTLQTLANDPKRLNAKIGFICVLHSWGATMCYHPHLHVIIPGCGLKHGTQLIIPKDKFLFPVKVMSTLFRGKFLDGLKQLNFDADTDEEIPYSELYKRDWVVFLKESMPGNTHVIEYLSRYTHKIAISNSRIVSWDEKNVTFKYKDYRDNNKIKEMTLTCDEFIRRLMLHVLPKGFTKVRFFGFLSNRAKAIALAQIRRLLNQEPTENRFKGKSNFEILTILYGDKFGCCHNCGSRNILQKYLVPVFEVPE